MSAVVHARVIEQLTKLRLRYVAERLDAVLADAARREPTYLDFLDTVLREEVAAKQRTRVTMGLKIAHFPTVKTLDEFDFKFQPSVDHRLVRELATGRFLAQAENVLIFGAPGVGKTHLAIALGRAVVEAGHSVLFTSATGLLAALAKGETEGQLADRLLFYSKPKLLIIDELGYLPFERRSAHLFFQLVARRYERGSLLITTNQLVTQWGAVFGDDVLAAAILDRLLHHSHTLMIQGEQTIPDSPTRARGSIVISADVHVSRRAYRIESTSASRGLEIVRQSRLTCTVMVTGDHGLWSRKCAAPIRMRALQPGTGPEKGRTLV